MLSEPNVVETPGGILASIDTNDIWAACGIWDEDYKLVRRFTLGKGKPDKGPSDVRSELYCGTENWGYRHIKNSHGSQWEGLARSVGMNWRDFTDQVIRDGLKGPQRVDYRAKNLTYTYQGSFWIKDSHGNIKGRYCSQIAVTKASGQIITAYPKSSKLPIGKCAKPSWKP